MRLESGQVQTDLKRHIILLGRLNESSMLACVMIMNGNDYDKSHVCYQTGMNPGCPVMHESMSYGPWQKQTTLII